jgi:hypothetical protein
MENPNTERKYNKSEGESMNIKNNNTEEQSVKLISPSEYTHSVLVIAVVQIGRQVICSLQ